MSAAFTVSRVDVDRDADVTAGLRAAVAGASVLARQYYRAVDGHDDFAWTPQHALHRMTHRVSYERPFYVALPAGLTLDAARPDDVWGFARFEAPLADNLHLIDGIEMVVALSRRRAGIGTALLDAVITYAREHGRTHLTAWATTARADPDDPAALVSRTDPIAARPNEASGFGLARGFSVAQIERYSVLQVPDSPPAGPPASGYAVESWIGPTPAARRADVAALWSAFSSDQPLGDVALEQESWDAERVADVEAASAGVVDRCTSVLVHEASGEAVAVSQLIRDLDKTESAYQGLTVVRRDHRGHGLGLAVKRANLAVARASWPGLRRVHTWNAGENDHMWTINEALGFVTAGAEVCWQRTL